MINIILYKVSFLVKVGLEAILSSDKNLLFCCDVSSENEIIRIIQNNAPKFYCVICTISGVERNLDKDLVNILAHKPKVPMLIISLINNSDYSLSFLKKGVSGIISRNAESKDIIAAVHKIVNGGIYLDSYFTAILGRYYLTQNEKVDYKLTPKEYQVAKLIQGGMNTTEIASTLNLKEKTIEGYRRKIDNKININRIL